MGFNRHMMALARDARGETQTSLARALDVGQGTVSKYEAGILDPPKDFVRDMAKHLRFREDLFYDAQQPYGMPPFHYRRRKKLGTKVLAQISAEINIRRIHVAKLLRSYEGLTRTLPEIDRDEYFGNPRRTMSLEDIAAHLRDRFMIGPGPIVNMVDVIESSGGIVVPCDFGTDLIDAMSQRVDGLPPLFFVNMNIPSDRMRHTLAHELAHMVLHTSSTMVDDDQMEAEADEFAGCFLLPANEVRPQLRNRFELRHLVNMKVHWRVSMQSLAKRSERLDLITPHQSKMFWIQMGKLGYRKREPHEPPKERPRLLREMIRFHLRDLGYSVEDLARLLYIYPTELQELYSRDRFESDPDNRSRRAHLRVVK